MPGGLEGLLGAQGVNRLKSQAAAGTLLRARTIASYYAPHTTCIVHQSCMSAASLLLLCFLLLQVPLANIALLRLGGVSTLVPADDTVYQLLMLVEASVPAAVTLLVCCSRVYPDIRPLSSMLFWQYVASLFTLPALLVWYLYMLDI